MFPRRIGRSIQKASTIMKPSPSAAESDHPELTEGGSDPAMTSGAGLRPMALATLTLTLIVLCVMLAYPVLPAITWGLALAILAYPMHRLIARYVTWPGLAAGISSGVVVAVIVGTMVFVTYQLTKEAQTAVRKSEADAGKGTLLEKAKQAKFVGPGIRWLEGTGMDVEKEVMARVEGATKDVKSLAQGSIAALVQFLVAIFILFYLLKEPGIFLDGMKDVLPLTESESDHLFTRATDSIHANLYATLITSIIDTVGFGVLFWWAGFPAWVLWTAVMFLLSLLPILGSGVVWVPAIGYLALQGHYGQAAVLLAWGIFTFTLIDNALYARIAGSRMSLHEVPSLIAFLGGLVIFGMSGIILGPLILAVAVGLLEIWKGRMARAA
ncbi:AI-2E family transporter [Tundrisphaera sp. TA3]|uniref:AI-2E family transporter n=1 Tax=Tundrisphaera sp. TA3 TaxID=3435775 RepID=UPI003EBC33EF